VTGVARQIRNVIDRLIRDGATVAREDGSRNELFSIAVPPALGEALGTWVRRENARRTIEVGLAYGISALYICEALVAGGTADVRHVAIDPYQTHGPDGRGFASCGLQHLEEAGLASLVEHHEEESQIALPRLLVERRTFDLAFIDGNHRFERVFLDLYYLGRLVRPGGLIVLDDYHLPGIERAVSFFLTNLGWELDDVAESDGHRWAAVRTSTAEDSRHFAYFVDF
jgi:predicted O-methyltransferase YrrM